MSEQRIPASNLRLNTEAERLLAENNDSDPKKLGFNAATMKLIRSSNAFVNAINSFFEISKGRKHLPKFTFPHEMIPEGGYNSSIGELSIRADRLRIEEPGLEGIQLRALTILAHELGHALSDWQGTLRADAMEGDKPAFTSMEDYVQRMMEEEGQAAYHQFMLISTLNIPDDNKRDMVQYLLPDQTHRQLLDLYSQLRDVILYDGQNPYIHRRDGIERDENGEVIDFVAAAILGQNNDVAFKDPSIFFKDVGRVFAHIDGFNIGNDGVTFTYHENFAWEWLEKRDERFVLDFMEAKGRPGLSKKNAIEEILANPFYLREIKVLLSGHNHYAGSDAGDTLTANEGGSVLGQAEANPDAPGSGQKNEVL